MKKQYAIIETGVTTTIMVYDVAEDVVIAIYDLASDTVSFVSGETHALEPIKRLVRHHYKGLQLEVNPVSLDFDEYE